MGVITLGRLPLGSRVLPSGPKQLHKIQEGPEMGLKQCIVGCLEDQPGCFS